jgi:hypothetical protein
MAIRWDKLSRFAGVSEAQLSGSPAGEILIPQSGRRIPKVRIA